MIALDLALGGAPAAAGPVPAAESSLASAPLDVLASKLAGGHLRKRAATSTRTRSGWCARPGRR